MNAGRILTCRCGWLAVAQDVEGVTSEYAYHVKQTAGDDREHGCIETYAVTLPVSTHSIAFAQHVIGLQVSNLRSQEFLAGLTARPLVKFGRIRSLLSALTGGRA